MLVNYAYLYLILLSYLDQNFKTWFIPRISLISQVILGKSLNLSILAPYL